MNVVLIMFRQSGEKRLFPLDQETTTIGRKNDCNIRIPLAVVSRRHAEVVMKAGSLTVKDLGASNGTFLNSRRVSEGSLKAGDQIVIGPVVFTVQVDGRPSDEEIVQIRTKLSAVQSDKGRGASVHTSDHVAVSDHDPISALEALASSADQTTITSEEDEDGE